MEDRTGRDRTDDELNAKLEKGTRVFFDFLNRHPDRKEQFIADTVEAGAPKPVVEQLLGNWPRFLAVARGDVEEDAGDMLDLMATAGAAERMDYAGR